MKNKKLKYSLSGAMLTFGIITCSTNTVFAAENPMDKIKLESMPLDSRYVVKFSSANQAFINKLAPYAQSSQANYRVLSSITLAQGILESGWGSSKLSQVANNLFGMKGRYNGKYVLMPTKEYIDGKWVTVNAEFRKYANWGESVNDHSNLFIKGVSWNKDLYKKVLNAPNYKVAAVELQNAGYATDPGYANKLINIVETYGLAKYDELYDTIISQQTVSENAKVTNVAGNAVWTKPYKVKGTSLVNQAKVYQNKDIQLTTKAVTKHGTYYQFKLNGKVIGWIDQKALFLYDKTQYDNINVGRAKITKPVDNGIWTKPYNVAGRQYVADATKYANQEIKLERKAKTAHGVYYQFSINKKVIGWLDEKALTIYPNDSVISDSTVALTGQISKTSGNAIWTKAYKLENTKFVADAEKYKNQDVTMNRQIETQHGVYYQFAVNGKTIGWLDKKAFTAYDAIEYDKAVSYEGNISQVAGNAVWTKPYRSAGTKRVTGADTYKNQDVKIIREAKTAHGIYYQFQVAGKTIGWLDKKAFTIYDAIEYDKAVSYEGNISQVVGNAVWTKPYLSQGTKRVTGADTYKNQDVKIIREAKTAHGIYYQFQVAGKTIGWLDKKAFTLYDVIEYNQAVNYDGKITEIKGNAIWTQPYYSVGTKRITGADTYKNQDVKIIREAKTAKGTYYQFQASGKTIGWLDKKAFTMYDAIEYDKAVNYNGMITQVAGNAIWTKPYRSAGTELIAAASAYQNKNAKIIREAKTVKGTYYQFQVAGKTIGWLDKKAFTIKPTEVVKQAPKSAKLTGKIENASNQSFYEKPYGTDDNKVIAPVADYERKTVDLVEKEITAKGISYKVSFENKIIGWVTNDVFTNIK